MRYRFDESDRVEFAKIMAALGATYDKEITTEMMRAYELALSDVPVGKVKRMALNHIRESKWFPRPSELRPSVDYRERWAKLAIEGHRQVTDDQRAWIENEPKRITFAGLDDE